MTVKELKTKVTPILKAHNVEYAAVFGSIARGTARKDSDVDLLIRYSISPGLWGHAGLAQTLAKKLHRKVDLVTERALRKSLIPYIKKDLQILYGKTKRRDL